MFWEMQPGTDWKFDFMNESDWQNIYFETETEMIENKLNKFIFIFARVQDVVLGGNVL